jgi:hypothetical protein
MVVPMSGSSPEARDDIPDHAGLVPDEIHDLIRRAHWQSAKSVEDVAPHQYVVIGWNKDDLTDEEFWFFVRTIKDLGRLEEWTPPEGFYDSGNRRPIAESLPLHRGVCLLVHAPTRADAEPRARVGAAGDSE